jgi:hypothetical protein
MRGTSNTSEVLGCDESPRRTACRDGILRRETAGRGTTTGGKLKALFGASVRQVESVVSDGNDLGITENANDRLIQRAVYS